MKIKIIICQTLLFTILLSISPYDSNNIRQVKPSAIDDFVQGFVEKTVPEEAKQIENNLVLNANRGDESILDKVKADVYTFVIEGKVYTIVDFYATGKLKTSSNDTFSIVTNDYLLPLEPLGGELYVKNKPSATWELQGELDAMAGLYGIELYGKQLANNKPYIRILVCFLSILNSTSSNAVPEYVVTYYQLDTLIIPIVPIVITTLLIIGAALFLLKRRNEKLKKLDKKRHM